MPEKKYVIPLGLVLLCLVATLAYIKERQKSDEMRTYYKHKIMILEEDVEQLRCNPFYSRTESGFLLIPPMCELPEMSQGYGENPNAYGGMGMPVYSHSGIDWGAEEGTAIRATHDGYVFNVYDVEEEGYHGYGTHIKLRSRDGQSGHETVYAHLSRIFVKKGDFAKQGSLIGYVGNTGYSSKSHLHFGLRFLWFCDEGESIEHPCEVLYEDNGNLGWIDPMPYMATENEYSKVESDAKSV